MDINLWHAHVDCLNICVNTLSEAVHYICVLVLLRLRVFAPDILVSTVSVLAGTRREQ